MPSNWNTSGRPAATQVPGPMIHQAPTTQGIREVVRKALPSQAPTETDYVDPYLFETGYFESREEYEQLMARPQSVIQLRKDVEKAPKKKRAPRATK